MKLVPLLRFWGRKRTEDDADLVDEFPEEMLQLPPRMRLQPRKKL